MWFDKYGLVTNSEGGESGNDILYTAHYVAGLYLSGQVPNFSALDLALSQCEVTPGLYNRLQGRSNWYQSHDDYVGLVSMSSFFQDERYISHAIYEYGIKRSGPPALGAGPQAKFWTLANALSLFRGPRWVYNNVNPGTYALSSWRGRRPEVVATIKMAIGKSPGLLGWLYWAGFMVRGILCTDPADTNVFTLRWHMALATRDSKNPLTRWIGNRLRKQIKNVYGDAGQMLKWYFGKDNAVEHPLVALLKGVQ